ncbi:Zn(II)2Cys6 transcription factor domain-containing protein [Aspergillus stella-maris]|uniref:Zn(II)2Cys6 transcription factor domain-containing protein n=1 Tax=Aspergillus stella-maris TaxID=1810926 RepID=UPI003CCD48A3
MPGMSSAPGTRTLAASDPDDAILSIVPLAATLSPSDPDRESDVSVKKRKRVRTGCFTCRDRHLKCDAAHGQCQNCLKSGRLCRRGVRLNFVDTQVVAPPTYIQPPATNGVTFRDDSRVIASEYVGGDEVYPPIDKVPALRVVRETSTPVQPTPSAILQHQLDRQFSIDDPMDLSLMQAFVSQIAPWLDVLDGSKHFTRVLPLFASQDSLLRAVITACSGAVVSSQFSLNSNERFPHLAAAAQMLAVSLESQQTDSSLCAAAALILEVAEKLLIGQHSTLSSRFRSPARALIRECQWNTQTTGLGGACSWISIVMEILECITSRKPLAWNPDAWSIDMNFAAEASLTGNEHLWVQRIIYICARVSDFRSPNARGNRSSTRNAETQRLQEWNQYNDWCEKWSSSIPRSMLPLGHIQPWQRHPQSAFPELWLLDRPAILAQLFYYLTQIMLVETNPLRQGNPHGLPEDLQRHAQQICGIVTNDNNGGVPIFSIPLFVIAAEYLLDKHAQEEVIAFLDQINRTTSLATDHHQNKLRETWGWHTNGHGPFIDGLDTGSISVHFHTLGPGNVHHDPLMDPFSHSIMEHHPYLDQHITYEHP